MRVALESTVTAHGLPWPSNLESARACEAAVRRFGAEPATIAIVDGEVRVGLTGDELESLATRRDIAKVSLQNLGVVCASRSWGATTVASTAHLASRAGIRVFATGGIGGVHRDAERSFDVSADLTALATTPIVTVCAGAKSILDLPRTLEVLETLGVPVIGWNTDEFPGFYSKTTGLRVTAAAASEDEVVRMSLAHWELGNRSAVLVVAPCPEDIAIPREEIDGVVAEALAMASESGVRGAAVTPFLLSRVAERTGGRSLAANLALLENNAGIAGRIAVAFGKERATVWTDQPDGH